MRVKLNSSSHEQKSDFLLKTNVCNTSSLKRISYSSSASCAAATIIMLIILSLYRGSAAPKKKKKKGFGLLRSRGCNIVIVDLDAFVVGNCCSAGFQYFEFIGGLSVTMLMRRISPPTPTHTPSPLILLPPLLLLLSFLSGVWDILGVCILTIAWCTDGNLPYAVFHYSKLCA